MLPHTRERKSGMIQYKFDFKRYEIKYIISNEEKGRILNAAKGHIKSNEFSYSTIRNVYFDTDTYLLIRTSLEKPIYKEKLRIRSYKQAKDNEDVFIELKKKFESIVYKRRLIMHEKDILEWIVENDKTIRPDTQIAHEIDYFRDFYHALDTKMFISYNREAYEGIDDKEFRITFDSNILARTTDLSLSSDIGGENILAKDKNIMEIKTLGAIPLWLADCLNENRIYKGSFSKYGMAYRMLVLPNQSTGGLKHEYI